MELRAQAGQVMSLNVTTTQGEAILVIYGADGSVFLSDHAEAKSWTGPLPLTQDYNIDIKAGPDSSANFSLQVLIPPLTTVVPQPTPVRVSFPRGGTSAVVQGSLAAGASARYIFRALAGQTVSLQVSSAQGRIILGVASADGNVLLADSLGSNGITFKLPTTQDYVVSIRSDGVPVAAYTLLIAIPPP